MSRRQLVEPENVRLTSCRPQALGRHAGGVHATGPSWDRGAPRFVSAAVNNRSPLGSCEDDRNVRADPIARNQESRLGAVQLRDLTDDGQAQPAPFTG